MSSISAFARVGSRLWRLLVLRDAPSRALLRMRGTGWDTVSCHPHGGDFCADEIVVGRFLGSGCFRAESAQIVVIVAGLCSEVPPISVVWTDSRRG